MEIWHLVLEVVYFLQSFLYRFPILFQWWYLDYFFLFLHIFCEYAREKNTPAWLHGYKYITNIWASNIFSFKYQYWYSIVFHIFIFLLYIYVYILKCHKYSSRSYERSYDWLNTIEISISYICARNNDSLNCQMTTLHLTTEI